MNTLDCFLSGFTWWRRFRGGHWEQWHIDYPVCSTLWFSRPHGGTPPGGRCRPVCEDYP